MFVRPVRIVDEQRERLRVGEPRAQPVEAVEAREQPIVGGRAVGNLLEQRAREARGAREQQVAIALATRSTLGASSWITTPRANSRSIAPPRARRTPIPPDSASSAASAIGRVLADPGRPLDHDHAARGGCRGTQRSGDLLQLGPALEQVGPPCQLRHRLRPA